MGTVARYRMAVVLLTAALLATLTVALTGGDRADAVDGPVEVVYIATGRNFPDALAGSTLASATNAPLLTVEKTLPIPQATIDALTALDPNRIIIFGGPAAVSNDVFAALTTYARSGNVTRLSGDDRHATAAAIADALPDKVNDADHLDGLDATDFLRTSEADQFLTQSDIGDLPQRMTVVEHATCPGVGFLPTTHPENAVWTGRNNTSRVIEATGTTPVSCPIQLPDGAEVTHVGFVLNDSTSFGDISSARLLAFPLEDGSPDEVAGGSGITGVAEKTGQFTASFAVAGHIVDNGTRQYLLEVRLSNGTGDSGRTYVVSATVTYEIERWV